MPAIDYPQKITFAEMRAAHHGSADQLGSKKGERDGHVDTE
jgi:hypothetical protein